MIDFHDDLCTSWRGHPCNCMMSVFAFSPTGRAPSEPETQEVKPTGSIAETMQKLYDSHDLSQLVIVTLGAHAGMSNYIRKRREIEEAIRHGDTVYLPMECSLKDAEARVLAITRAAGVVIDMAEPVTAEELKISMVKVRDQIEDMPDLLFYDPKAMRTHPASPKETMRGNRNKRRKHRRR